MQFQRIPGMSKGEGISRTSVYKNEAFQVIHLLIPAGKELKKHISDKDAVVIVLDGQAEFTLEDEKRMIHKNDSVGFKAQQPHSILAITDFSMLLMK